MAWHPSPDEIFVFRKVGTQHQRVVLLIPGGVLESSEIRVNGDTYLLDSDATDQASMFVHVDNVKRGLAD